MKYNNFLVFLVLVSLLLMPVALAPSHPVFIDEGGQTIDSILDNKWADAGVSSGIFHSMELWWEDVTNVPPDEQLRERLAEAHSELTAGNIEAARDAIEEAQTSMIAIGAEVKAVEGNADNFNDYVDHAEEAIALSEQVDALTYELEQVVTTGVVPADSPITEALENSLDTLQDDTVAVGNSVGDLRDEIVNDIAHEQGITSIEAENILEVREEGEGTFAIVLELEAQDELIAVREDLTALGNAIDTAQAAGEIVDPATLQLLYEATARFEHAQGAIEDGNFGEAHSQLTAAWYIAENAENHLEGREEIPPELDSSVVREERLAEVRQFVEEAPALLTANPELTDNVEVFRQELRVEDKITELLAEEPTRDVYEEAAHELGYIYGQVDYIPPVFTGAEGEAVSRLANFEEVASNLQTTGGFVEDYAYLDPATGHIFTFTETGYQYITPFFGTVHKQDYPKELIIPDAFSTGIEQHTYTTSDGNKYTYTSLGYSVSKDGTTDSFAYDLGEYGIPGGGKLEIDPQGYAVFNERGRQEGRMEYMPEFGTYVHTDDGRVHNPDDFGGVVPIHDGAIHYDYDKHNYVFDPEKATQFMSGQYEGYAHYGFRTVPGDLQQEEGAPVQGWPSGPGWFGGQQDQPISHDEWSYDPVTNTWTDEETGESRISEVNMIAPVGYEGQGSYSTDYGETWNFDGNGWTSNKGEKFMSREEGKIDGNYFDVSGKEYDYSHEGTYTDTTGVAWSYDGSSHGWTSEGAATGTSAPGGTAPSTGTAVDQQGNVWSYTPGLESGTGTWSSPTYTGTDGHTATDGHMGSYTAPPSDTDTGGYTSGGMTGDAGSSGGMTGDSGSPGGYSGGDGGGSGGGDGGGGGMSGGDGGGGGGMGYAVREPREARELHPVTRFIYKYLGIKN